MIPSVAKASPLGVVDPVDQLRRRTVDRRAYEGSDPRRLEIRRDGRPFFDLDVTVANPTIGDAAVVSAQ